MTEIRITVKAETPRDALDLLAKMDFHLTWHINENDHFELGGQYGAAFDDFLNQSETVSHKESSHA